jgi:hypothetical protein
VTASNSLAVDALLQADGALGLLSGDERVDAERLVALCRGHWTGDQRQAASSPEIRQLSEKLARRGAKAMPFGALGRALLAELHGADKDARDLLLEFQSKLAMLGL